MWPKSIEISIQLMFYCVFFVQMSLQYSRCRLPESIVYIHRQAQHPQCSKLTPPKKIQVTPISANKPEEEKQTSMETFEQTRTLKDGYFVASEDGPTTYFGERTEDSIVCSCRTLGLMCSRCGSRARLRPSQRGAKKTSTPANPIGIAKWEWDRRNQKAASDDCLQG